MTPPNGRSRWVGPFLWGLALLAASNLSLLAEVIGLQSDRAPHWMLVLTHPAFLALGNGLAIVLLTIGLVRLVSGPSQATTLARSLARKGDLEGAGEAMLRAGRPRQAMRYFERARSWVQAGRAALQCDRPERAAELFRRAGGSHLESAARIYRQMGRRDDARTCDAELARWLAAHGKMPEAVEAWLRAGEPLKAVRAARLALSEGQLKPNVRSFDAARKAAEQTRSLGLSAELAELAEDWPRAAAIWRQLEDHDRAARCFRLAGRLEDAAAEEEAAGRLADATQLRLTLLRRLRQKLTPAPSTAGESGGWRREIEEKIRQLEARVIPALERLGLEDELIKELSASGQSHEVIQRLTERGDLEHAAEEAAQADRPDLAAALYEESKRWGEASDLWELAGDLVKAARCAEFNGEDERALMLYAASGDVLGEARCLARSGRLEESLSVLHRHGLWKEAFQILRDHPGPVPDAPDVVQDLAQSLWEDGQRHEAIAVLQRAVVGVALTPERLGPPVMLARLLMEQGEHEAALEQLERVLDFDYSNQPAHMLRQQVLQTAPGLRRSFEPAVTAPSEEAAERRYEILAEVGRGGMGVVYKARDTRLEREVAIKVLRTTRQEEILRLEREAKAAATLNHAGIVTIYDFEQGFGGYFIVMEFADGEPLDRLLRTNSRLIQEKLGEIMIQAADAVAYAHSRNVIHRDLKPGNLLLTRDGRVKILDFGIAARLDRQLSPSDQVCGTPYYMAPEQIRGEPPSPASDIYSLGATFFHLATGRPPFVRGNIIQSHLSESPPDPRTLNPTLAPGLARVILRCLAKSPEDRFQEASELRRELTAAGA